MSNWNTISCRKFYIYSVMGYLAVCAWLAISFYTEGQTSIIVCPSKLIYHIPCPGCGLTRGTLAFLRGDIQHALWRNANSVLSVLFVVLYPVMCISDAILHRHDTYNLYLRIDALTHKRWFLILFLSLEAIVWGHSIYIGN